MAKILGSILIILSATMIGIGRGQRLRDRLLQLKSLKKTITLLKGEIRYGNSALPEAFNHISGYLETPFSGMFEQISRELNEYEGKTFAEIWKKHVDKIKKLTSLKDEQIYQLKALGENLGYLDKEMQLNTLDLYNGQLEFNIQILEESIVKTVRLYNCLGMMGGILIVLIII